MKELVSFLAKQLVNQPDAVEVKETQGETASVLELRVAKEDLGRVIGKQGRHASRPPAPAARAEPSTRPRHPARRPRGPAPGRDPVGRPARARSASRRA